MLSKKEMKAAHFVRFLDLMGDYADLRGEERAAAFARDTYPETEGECGHDYQVGAAVLEKYTLAYSTRFVTGAARPTVPTDITDVVAVSSGHLATSEASRLAMFKPR